MRGYIVNLLTEDQKRYAMRDQAAFYDQPLLNYGSFSRTSSTVFWIKRKHKYKILKNFQSKNNFPISLKITKKYSSKYNDYMSVINIAQNFGHVQNKNFNL